MRRSWIVLAAVLAAGQLVAGAAVATATNRMNTAPQATALAQPALADMPGTQAPDPGMGVQAAMPGMPTQSRLLEVHNPSEVTVDYAVTTTVEQPTAGPSLDEVLAVTVRVESSDRIVYQGRLSELELTGSELAPDETARYVLEIDWPRVGENHNSYQGQQLAFSLRYDLRQSA
jgi:hypothetical protein